MKTNVNANGGATGNAERSSACREQSAELNDRVEVYTVFHDRGRKIEPVKFRWRGRTYAIEEITYTWKSIKGATEFIHFAVRDMSDLFELVFNTRTFVWELHGTESLAMTNIVDFCPL